MKSFKIAATKNKTKELTSFCMCGPYPRRRYYHIREFQMAATSQSEVDSDGSDSKDEIELPSLEISKNCNTIFIINLIAYFN